MMKHLFNKKINLYVIPIIIFFLTIVIIPSVKAIQVTASVNNNTTYVGQALTYSVKISGIQSAPKPQLPSIPNCSVHYTGTESGFSAGGSAGVLRFITFKYIIKPLKSGPFTIGASKVTIKGKEYTTKPINITVKTGSPPARQKAPARRDPFQQMVQGNQSVNMYINPFLSKKTAYVNESVKLIYFLYLGSQVGLSLQGFEKPSMQDVWVENIPIPNNQKPVYKTVNGKRYIVYKLVSYELFPTTAGTRNIGPAEFHLNVEQFFSFFGKRKLLKSPALTIQVKKLPENNKPGNFDGAVGNFSVTSSVDRKTLNQNEAFSLKIKISGNGNIKSITKPIMPELKRFKIYNKTSRMKTDLKKGNLNGSKTFEYTLMPLSAGKLTIGKASYSYFDPKTKTYKTANSKPIILNIKAVSGKQLASSAAFQKHDIKLLGEDIRFIKEDSKKIDTYNITITRPVILFLFELLFILALFLSIGYNYYNRILSSDIKMARASKAAGKFRKTILKIEKKIKPENLDEIISGIEKVFSDYIGNRFNISSTNIILDKLEKIMGASIDSKTINITKDIIDECRSFRYTPSGSREEVIRRLIESSKETVKKLEKTNKKGFKL